MASASSSTLVRWRPAVITLAVVSAGLAIYHLRDGLQLLHEPLPPQLHRSRAVHRRTRHHGRSRAAQPHTDPAVYISSQQLVRMFVEGSDTFGFDQAPLRHPATDQAITVARSTLPFLPQILEQLEPEEAEQIRAEFEERLLVTFLCMRMPLQAVLRDPDGQRAYVRTLENEGFERPAVVARVLTAWNLGKYLEAPERLHFQDQISRSEADTVLPIPVEAPEVDVQGERSGRLRSDGQDDEGNTTSESDESRNEDGGSELSWRHEDDDDAATADEGKKEGQTLLNMLYHIAEEQSKQYGYVHRGVSCNSCNMLPIRGIRYRCSNCPDYDLCEQCEAMQVHPKTHLLYKIRVPAPFFDNSQRPQDPRYPGRLNGLPNHLPRHISKQLSQQSGRELAEIEALWDTFKCLATKEWPSDPLEFGIAVDRDCFDLCFLASTATSRRPPNLPMHDRIFAFFDSNKDNLIGFEEFIMGIATIRTKDKGLKLKRTFWVYDFDEDGYVCRNDFLFMFKSYYALSKELTLDMIKNMEYDVIDGPNPQDIILGTQPISAAYNGAVPQQNARKRQEGKELNLDGERFIFDGGGVITETEDDLANYWDIIADTSEKAVFGYVIDPHSLEPFRSETGKSAASSDEHPFLNRGWCPPFVTPDDIETSLGHRMLADEVTEKEDRRKCVVTAIQRRDDVRRLGIDRRKQRSAFFDPRPVNAKGPEDVPNGDSHSNLGAGPNSGARTSTNAGIGKRIPPPLEDNVGQEFLFQMLQEGLNELLDPLFLQREELAIEARKTRKYRDKIRDKLDAFATPSMRKLCAHQVNTLEILPAEEMNGIVGDVHIGRELRKIISLQEQESTDEFAQNLKMMLDLKIIEEDEYRRRIQTPKAVNIPTDEEDADDGKISPLSERAPITSPRVDAEVAEPFSGVRLDRLLDELSEFEPLQRVLTAPVANTSTGHSRLEAVGEENQESREVSVSAQQVAADIAPSAESTLAVASIDTQLQQAVSEFDEADAAVEQFIMSQELDDLLSLSGYSTLEPLGESATTTSTAIANAVPSPTREEFSSAEQRLDLTLPQNRPNSDADIVQHHASSTRSASTRSASTRSTSSRSVPEDDTSRNGASKRALTDGELKYHLMLDCLEKEDIARGGAGRLDLEEFQAIMDSERGRKLNFTGMFFEMVNF